MILPSGRPVYGSSYDGYIYWKVNKNNLVTAIYEYNTGTTTKAYEFKHPYNVSMNTYEESSAKLITKKEFIDRLRKLKKVLRSIEP